MKRHALLIGIDKYDNSEITNLDFASRDAARLAEVFETVLNFDQVRLMHCHGGEDLQPTGARILHQLDLLQRRLQPEDLFVFFFAGHGLQDQLLPKDTDPYSELTLKRTGLDWKVLKDYFQQFSCLHKALFLDCCRKEPIRDKGVGDNLLTSKTRDVVLQVVKATEKDQATGVLFSCDQGERAYEWRDKEHGVFSYYLLEGLTSGHCLESDGSLTMDGLSTYVRDKVASWSDERGNLRRQNPVYEQKLRGRSRLVLGQVSLKKALLPEIELDEEPLTGELEVICTREGLEIVLGDLTRFVSRQGIKQWVRNVPVGKYEIKALDHGQAVWQGQVEVGYDRASQVDIQVKTGPEPGEVWTEPVIGEDEASRKAKEYYSNGQEFSKKRKWYKAIQAFTRAIELKPDYATAYHNRGYAYLQEGGKELAIADYTRAIELKPDAIAYEKRGDIYDEIGQHDLAIADYTRAIELGLNFAGVYRRRGDIYDNKGQYDLAISDYNKAIELYPDGASSYNCRGKAYYNKGEYDRAIADYTRAIELDPDYAFAYFNRGIAYRHKNMNSEAESDMKKYKELTKS